MNGQAGCHRMAPVAHQQVVAFAQSGGEIEAFNAPARSAPVIPFPAQNNRGPVKLLKHPRRDNADHADVPEHLSLDDDEIALGIESRPDRAGDLFGNAALDPLPFAISHIKLLGNGRGFGSGTGKHESQGFLGIFEPTRGIESRSQLETHLIGSNDSVDLRDLLQREKPGPAGLVEPFETDGCEDSILPNERHEVSDRPQRHEIKKLAQVNRFGFRPAGGASLFQNRMSQFEGQSHGTKLAKIRRRLR